MKTFLLLLFIIFTSLPAKTQWISTAGPPSKQFAGTSICIADGNILVGTGDDGMYISTDHGQSWIKKIPDVIEVYDFINIDGVVLCGYNGYGVLSSMDHGLTWDTIGGAVGHIYRFASAGSLIYATNGFQIYWTDNDGSTWTQLSGHIPTADGISSLAIRGTDLLVGTHLDGVFLSSDNGHTWIPVNEGLTDLNVLALTVKGENIFAGTSSGGVFLSTNHGESWLSINHGIDDLMISSFHVAGDKIFAGTASGLFLSTNDGTIWTEIHNGLSGDMVVLALSGAGTELVLGSNGSGFFISDNTGLAWVSMTGLPVTDINSILVKGSVLFAGTQNDGLFRTATNEETWTKSMSGIPEWYSINAMAVNGNNLFAGTVNGIYRSANNGASWAVSLAGYSITSFAVEGNYTYAGSNNGGVFWSPDGGTTWYQVNGGLPTIPIGAVAINGTVLYAGTGGNGIYRSLDNGNSWTPVNNGLTNQIITSLLIEGINIYAGTGNRGVFRSANSGDLWTNVSNGEIHALASIGSTLFAGTSNGVEMSIDAGDTWIPVNEGLNWTGIYSLASSGTTLYAGTAGYGVFKNSTLLTGTEDETTLPLQIKLSPNPAHQSITLEVSDEAGVKQLTVFNSNGQNLIRQPFIHSQTTIDLSRLHAGIYFIRIAHSQGTDVVKFVKQ